MPNRPMRRLLVPLLVVSCATPHPKTVAQPAADTRTLGGSPTVPDPSLLELVPDDAQAALVIRKSAIAPFRHALLDEDPVLRDELRAFLQERLGADLTRVDGVVAFATRLAPKPELAMLLHFDGEQKSTLHGAPAGEHLGTPLVTVGKELVAALIPAGLVVGNDAAVRAEIALSRQPISARVPQLFSSVSADAPFVAALDATQIRDPGTMFAVASYGTRRLTLVYQRPDLVRLTVSGDAEKLTRARDLLTQLLQRGLREGEAQKQKLVASSDTLSGAGAIIGYHSTRRIFEGIAPKMVNGALVSEYHLPSGDAGMAAVPVLGVLAAVAIPAFMKYLRRSKETEARAALAHLKNSLTSWHAEHQKDGKRFAFPASIDWTPAGGCCGQPDGKCTNTDFSAWKPLDFSVEGAQRFQYRFTSSGRGNKARFTIEARADLDCDGHFSTFERAGRLNDRFELIFEPTAD
jgi:type IV pilus assembly protein PilA